MKFTKAEREERWANIQAGALGVVGDDPVVEDFPNRVETIFGAVLDQTSPPFRRRPPLSIRLIGDDLTTKLIAMPHWTNYYGVWKPDIERAVCELYVDGLKEYRGEQKQKLYHALTTTLQDGSISFSRLRSKSDEPYYEDVTTALRIMRDFCADQGAVFARSHEHCCVCGRALSDGVSQSRGVGPECVQKLPDVVFGLGAAKLIQVETVEPALL